MLITTADLLESITEISALQLAYLVKVEAIDGPITLPSEPMEFLFDSEHVQQVRKLLCHSSNKRHHESRESIDNNARSTAAYSDAARNILKKQPVIPAADLPDKDIELFFSEAMVPWYKRAWRYLISFRPFKVKLTAEEQLDIVTHQAIAMAKLRSRVVFTVSPRLRRFDFENYFDRCLHAYSKNYEHIGWGRFVDELDLVGILLKEDPDLQKLPTGQGLQRICEIEKGYNKLESQVTEYMNRVDPEGLIAKRLFRDSVAKNMLEITKKAFERGEHQFQELLNDKKG